MRVYYSMVDSFTKQINTIKCYMVYMYIKDKSIKIRDKLLNYLGIHKHYFGGQASNKIKHTVNYNSFAFFIIFLYMLSFFFDRNSKPELYSWELIIKIIGTLLCIGILLEHSWPMWLKSHFKVYWYLTLFYCLPFTFTLFLLLSEYSIFWVINISLTITLLLVLVDSIIFVLLILSGSSLAFITYIQLIGYLPKINIHNLILLTYSTTLSIAIALIFFRQKERNLTTLTLQNDQLIELQQRHRQELVQALQYRKQLFEELEPKEATVFDEVTSAYIHQAIYRMTD